MIKNKLRISTLILLIISSLFSLTFSHAAEELAPGKMKYILTKNNERILCVVHQITQPNGNIQEAYYQLGEKKASWYKTIYDHKKETLDKCPAQAKEGWFFILDDQYVTYRKGALNSKEKQLGLRAFKSKSKAMFESVIASLKKETTSYIKRNLLFHEV